MVLTADKLEGLITETGRPSLSHVEELIAVTDAPVSTRKLKGWKSIKPKIVKES